MDPVTLIVAALAAGAATGLKDTAATAVREAYSALKAFLSHRYGKVRIDDVESKPESEAKRESLTEDLTEAGAAKDQELLDLARQLVVALRENDASAGQVIGVDLDHLEADFVKIGKVSSTGTGVRAADVRLKGGFEVDDVNAGREAGPENP
jgi:hypothetical protein